jgi:hypothetical protein
MKKSDKLIKVYTGTEVLVYILKSKLEEKGISCSIQNDSNNSFLRGVPAAIDLYIQQTDFQKAEPLIKKFISNNPD